MSFSYIYAFLHDNYVRLRFKSLHVDEQCLIAQRACAC